VVEGVIRSIRHDRVESIRAVPSYDSESLPWASTLAAGQEIVPTIDILTLCAQVCAAHVVRDPRANTPGSGHES
jgi:hypothetical protein